MYIVDCGDHVVVINSKQIAFPGEEWRRRVYFHHTGYSRGASWTPAWILHDKDPTMVCYYYSNSNFDQYNIFLLIMCSLITLVC